MDLEKIEKLHELKEKGILSDEEFEKEKQKLLNDDEASQFEFQKKKTINWKNVGISFLISLVWFLCYLIVGQIISIACDIDVFDAYVVLNIITAAILALISIKFETKKYKNCSSAIVIFIVAVLITGPCVWAAIYQFLQIKQGYAVLKSE